MEKTKIQNPEQQEKLGLAEMAEGKGYVPDLEFHRTFTQNLNNDP